MHDFFEIHHNCDAYIGVQKKRKSTFLTLFELWEKEGRSLFAAQYWYRSFLWIPLSSGSSVSSTISGGLREVLTGLQPGGPQSLNR